MLHCHFGDVNSAWNIIDTILIILSQLYIQQVNTILKLIKDFFKL